MVMMNSKTWNSFCAFIVLIIIGNVYSSPALSMDAIEHVKDKIKDFCMDKVGVTQEQLDPFKENNPTDDRDVGCYFGCLLTLAHVLKNNTFDPDVALKRIHLYLPDIDNLRERTLVQLEACKDEVSAGTDNCHKGLVTAKCMLRVDHKTPLLPL